MKTLILLRHAKSSWKDGALDDHDRPLNKRGELAAPRMGVHLKELELQPHQVLCSTAARARATAEAVARTSGFDGAIDYRQELYLASAGELLKSVASEGRDSAERILLVAHNPGMETLNGMLSGTPEPFPTAAMAAFSIEIGRWGELEIGRPTKPIGIWRPREL